MQQNKSTDVSGPIMSKFVIACDPGKTTGIAYFGDPREGGMFSALQIEGRKEFAEYFEEDLRWQPDMVIAELYTVGALQRSITNQNDALYINGWLELECHLRNIPFMFAPVSATKKFATDDKLKALGWYTPTKGGHANDAARHLLTYLAKRPEGQELLRRILDES